MTQTFGGFLKQLRKRGGMTQDDLAAATGYSRSLIGALERNDRLPDIELVIQSYLPALGLQEEPRLAVQLVELAALARGERPPAAVTFQCTPQLSVHEARTTNSGQLPSPPTELIGRAIELNQLCNRLLGHTGRLLTLVGPPGIGKTTLALAVAARLQLHYRDGAVFVPLAAISDPTLLASTILAAVGGSNLDMPKTRLIEQLRRKTMLLVLDNLEQISEAAPLIAELVAECSGLCLLATSRERLHLRAEQRFKVPPLELAPAVDLFVQRAQTVNSDFVLTSRNRPTLEAICQRLDCLPLALELGATQIELLSLSQLLAQLQDHRLELLVDGAHDLPPQHRTLRLAIARSYALLTETERLLLRSLGVFAGGFDLEAVRTVSGWAQESSPYPLLSTLHALIGKSLVRAETLPSGEQRFLLLETIREFALEQVRAQSEEGVLRERHYAFYLQLFRTGDSHLRGAESATWFARLEPEQGNLHTALQGTLDEARYVDAAWLIIAAFYFWHFRGYWYESGMWLAQLLPHRQALTPDLRLVILLFLYAVARALEEFQPMSRYTDEVMELLEGGSDKRLHTSAWYWFAWYASSDVSQTIVALERSIELARADGEAPRLGPEFGIMADRDFKLVIALWGYATFLLEHGEVERAAPSLAECLELFRKRENHYEIADGLGTSGLMALLQGDIAQAHTLFQEAVTIATTFNFPEMLACWQPLLGLVTLYGGDATEARRLLCESLGFCLNLRDKSLLARSCNCLAEVALWEGELDEAKEWLTQSLSHYADPHQVTIYEVERLWIAARLTTAQQQYLRAARLFGLANQAHSQIHYAIAGPMRALATVQAALDVELFAKAFAAGQVLSFEEAFATILAPTQPTSVPMKA